MLDTLTAKAVGDAEIHVARHFKASPERVFEAFTTPAIVETWLTGPDGWTMTICEIAPEVGAPVRYRWENQDGEGFGLEGTVTECDPPHRMVHTELFDIPGATDTGVVTTFAAEGAGTRVEMVITYQSQEARDMMLQQMPSGLEMSYSRLDAVLR